MTTENIYQKLNTHDINTCITRNGDKMKDTKDNEVRIRLTSEDKNLIETNAKNFGFVSVSEYLRYIGKNCKEIKIKIQ